MKKLVLGVIILLGWSGASISPAGDFDGEQVKAWIEKYFGMKVKS
jgi:hypothetical protein